MKAKIITFDEFDAIRDSLGTIVCTSGGYDPVHPGHLSCIHDSKSLGDTMIVIVNGDAFLRNNKGKPFMDIRTRSEIMTYAVGADYIIPFEIENDQTVIKALERIRPHIFTKGGDRVDETSIPEWGTCVKHNIKVISGVGYDKQWSSSDLLADWVKHHSQKIAVKA
jgi:cytidyltransferase-like protein